MTPTVTPGRTGDTIERMKPAEAAAGAPDRAWMRALAGKFVVFDGERFRLYTMHERVDLHWGERPAR